MRQFVVSLLKVSCHRHAVSCLCGLPWWLAASRQAWDGEDGPPEADKHHRHQALPGKPFSPLKGS